MLVLSMETEDRIVIEHAGEILVLSLNELRGAKARVGFEGPRDFQICREKARKKSPPQLLALDQPELAAV